MFVDSSTAAEKAQTLLIIQIYNVIIQLSLHNIINNLTIFQNK